MKQIDVEKLKEMLLGVSRPGRYLGNEWNVVKKDLDRTAVRFALAFPDVYDVGMSYLGLRIIYGVLNAREDTACERVFAPWVDLEAKMRENKIPLFSLESKAPIRDFDIIGFSLTYELNYTNVLNMLDLAGIPLRAKDRDNSFPIIIAGGPSAFNPAPMEEFIDAFVIGEGEEVVLEIVDVYKRVYGRRSIVPSGGFALDSRWSMVDGLEVKEKLLKEIAKLEGVYVPRFSKEVKKRSVKNLDASFYPVKDLVPYIQIVHDRITLEIMRGCPFNCKFCQAGAFYKPVRVRSHEKIMDLAREIYRNTGYDEISLLSLSSSSCPDILSLITKLTEEFEGRGIGISLPSLRSEEVLKLLPSLIAKVRKSGLTFAIEAGSKRLRRHISKDIDVEKVAAACQEAFDRGWRLVKFYFMIGLPTETWDDLAGIPDFINTIAALRKDAEISVSITAFVPKVGTQFADERPDELGMLLEKQKFIKDRIKNRRVKLRFHDARVSYLEGKLSRPEAGLASAIYRAWQEGARLDAWDECFNFERWKKAFSCFT
ncbi:MAG: TIGR03960 family B12-binding radical SAM protein [Candidatus Omnitrophica bacterium]|nr:TIGR03960 family B12-binding radical SAM protein [Candidatus Omnitrophota bacterium]